MTDCEMTDSADSFASRLILWQRTHGRHDLPWQGANGMTRCAQASGAGMPSPRRLPQSAGSAITSDLASVVGSPSRMASSFTSNVSKAGMAMLDENIAALRQRIPAPLLGIVPHLARPDAREAASFLNLALLDKQD